MCAISLHEICPGNSFTKKMAAKMTLKHFICV